MSDVEHDLQCLIAEEYEFDAPDHCRLLRGGYGANDTYGASYVDGRRYVLRLQPYPPSQKKSWITGESDIRFELDLLTHLHNHGVPVSYPLPRRNGDPLGCFDSSDGKRLYSLFTWAPGRTVDVEHQLTSNQARVMGQTLATIHHVADHFETTHSRYNLDEAILLDKPLRKLDALLGDVPKDDAQFVGRQVEEIRERLHAFVPGPKGWGIIHADLQGLNHHFTNDGQVTLFDFDLCGYGWRAYDIAYYYTRISCTVRQSVLDGYNSVRTLSHAELDMISTFGRAAWVWEGVSPQELVLRLRNPYI